MISAVNTAIPATAVDGARALPADRDARSWTTILNRYRAPHAGRSLVELAITIVPFVLLWSAMWAALSWSYWLTLLLAIPAAGLLVRLFAIQHDCGHGSFFRQRHLNDWIGRVLSVLTLTPYDHWRRTHNQHHATSGNLGQRGIGDIAILTVDEYAARSALGRLGYRLYRHPLVMFGLGPAYLFYLQQRLPLGLMRHWGPWISAMVTNFAIVLAVVAMIWLIGLGPFLLVHIPITLLAASIGGWLFYVQHQFEETVWDRNESWSFHDAALHGSSHYDLPPVLRWFTANIGAHHIHHLCSRIPFYRLPQVLRDHPRLAEIGRMSLPQSLRCMRLALWDDSQRRLISFRDLDGQAKGRSQRAA